ncbi:MAG TPA: ATP-binding protein [Lentimicrobium sp.]|nr:ATP-binding protein [Lentimicrobium sp.]
MDHDTRGFDHQPSGSALIELQEELRQLKEQYSHMYDSNPHPMVIYDPETLFILDANEAALEFYGYQRDEIYSLTILDVRPAEDIELIKQHLSKPVLPNKSGVWRHKKKSGEIVYVNIVSNAIMFNGRNARYVVTSDVTGVVLAEQHMKEMMGELVEAKLKAEESDRLKSAFLANMSHEIRTPMNGILGFMDLLQEPDLSGAERNEYIQLVKASGDRLLNTIKDIIDISKIEAGAVDVIQSHFNLNQIIIRQCNFFKPEAERKNLQLLVSALLPSLKAEIVSDLYKIESIIINLLKNAIKFTSAGSITIGCRMVDENLCITVADTGKGIPADLHDYIFERFVQANNAYSRDFEGSGLGLSICRSYAKLLGGNITVSSEPWKGSVFTVTIPYKTSILQSDSPENKGSIEHSVHGNTEDVSRNLNILVAEDDDVSFIYFRSVISRLPINLTRAVNGQEAISLVDECNGCFDVIFMDMKMPVLDGYEATHRIRQRYPNVPVIALTAYSMSHDEAKVKQAGCSDYLSKPVKKDLLVKMIEKWATKG